MSVQAGMAAPAAGRWPKVYIVLVNWNGWADTVECLESVFRLDYPSYEVLVCDNASGDGSLEKIEAWARGEGGTAPQAQNPALAHLVSVPPLPKPIALQRLDREAAERGAHAFATPAGAEIRLRLIPTGANLGFAGGNNVGIRHALQRGDAGYVWLLNNDTVVEPGALKALVQRAETAGGRSVVGSTLLFYGEPDKVQAAGCASYSQARGLAAPLLSGQARERVLAASASEIESQAAYVVGASMLVPAEFLRRVGLMAEDYFLYFEELDWAERGRREGFGIAYAPESVVYHKVGASTGGRHARRLTLAMRLSYLNRVLISERYFAGSVAAVRLRILAEALRELVQGNMQIALFAFQVATGLARRPAIQ